MNAAARRWYAEPMVWLLIALPLASVVATGALMHAAGVAGPLDSAPEPVQRSAQVQQRDLAADRRALELGLAAVARRDGDTLRVDATALPAAGLQLELVHPLDARRDRRVVARGDGDPLVIAGFDAGTAWHLRLAAASGEWRLVGRWDPARPEAAVVLRPALGADAAGAR